MDFKETEIVEYDLESTSLDKTAEICQIAAVCDTNTFNGYITPVNGISKVASKVTGLTITASVMYLGNTRIDTELPEIVLKKFIEFLVSIGKKLVLVSHNGFRFDAPLLLSHLNKFGLLEDFISVVYGFADSLLIFKTILVDRKKEKKSFQQKSLAIDYLGPDVTEDAHNAINDVLILNRLIGAIGVSKEIIQKNARSVKDMIILQNAKLCCTEKKISLGIIKDDVSAGMRSKMALAGIDVNVLKKAYQETGEEGIKLLLGQDVNGRPLVNKNNKVIANILNALKKLD